MNEYGIIKVESDFVNDGTYSKILTILNNCNLSICETVSYSTRYNKANSSFPCTEYKYLVNLVRGKNIQKVLTIVKLMFNIPNLDYNKQIYISSKEFFDFDLRKYFNISKINLNTNIDKENVERTLAIIKPEAYKFHNEIKSLLVENGLSIVDEKVTMLNRDLLREHYSHLVDKSYYFTLENYMMSGPVNIMVLEGVNAVEKLRKLMGPTDSTQASINTIRGLYGTDIMHNAIHGSDSIENAELEIKRFFTQKQKSLKYKTNKVNN